MRLVVQALDALGRAGAPGSVGASGSFGTPWSGI
jgi:hypothetical protein